MTTPHRCARPDTFDAHQPWRCLDCGTLWEPLPATPTVAGASWDWRGWAVWIGIGTAARSAGFVALLVFMWTIGLRTLVMAMLLCALPLTALVWAGTKVRGMLSKR